ncbi:glycosyltransferase [Oscillospiraceae bacterium OttesenSCG-928-G22]|nr:glycosyltransferase [Oscillospiraceae bacterium OttesenSCG-928-G22]
MKISACLITKNEESCIARCLNSIKGLVDEIIINDTGSTDRTVEIARSLGAEVFETEWVGDFAEARNKALDRATGDWVLNIDADEYLRKGMGEKIRQCLEEQMDATTDIVFMKNYNYAQNKPDGSKFADEDDFLAHSPQTDTLLCVYKAYVLRRSVIRWYGSVHENPLNKSKAGGTEYFYFDGDTDYIFLHDGYTKDLIGKKSVRNAEIIKKEIDNGTATPGDNFYYGTFTGNRDPREGVEYLKVYNRSGGFLNIFGMQGFTFFWDFADKMGMPLCEREKELKYAVKIFEKHPVRYMLHADLELRKGYYRGFINCAETAIELRRGFNDPHEQKHMKTELLINHIVAELVNRYVVYGEHEHVMDACIKAHSILSENIQKSLPSINITMSEGNVGVQLKNQREEVLKSVSDRFFASTRRVEERKARQYISRLFDTEDYVSLEFILPYLRKYRATDLFLEYFEKWYGMTAQNDINMFTMMAVVGEYRTSINKYLERYESSEEESYLYKAIAVAVMAGGTELKELAEILPGDSGEVANAILSGDLSSLADDKTNGLFLIFEDVLSIKGPGKALEFARLITERFGQFAYLQIARTLTTFLYYEEAIGVYEEALTHRDASQNSNDVYGPLTHLNCILGKREGIEWAYKAVAEGYDPRPIREYIVRLLELMPQGPYRKRAMELYRKLDNYADYRFPYDPLKKRTNKEDRLLHELLLQMTDLGPKWGKALRSHFEAEAYNRSGKREEAEQVFLSAFDMAPDYATVLVDPKKPAHSYVYSPPNEVPEPVSACPVCGGATAPSDMVNLLEGDYIPGYYPLRGWVVCEACGHVAAEDRGERGDISSRFDPRESIARKKKPLLRKLADGATGLRVLVFGTGDGTMLRAAVEEGHAVSLVEPNEELAEKVGGTYNLTAAFRAIADIPESEMFDRIILDDTLAEEGNPAELLAAVRKRLSPSGSLLIRTPDAKSAFAEKCGERNPALRAARYRHFYTESSLRALLQHAGFAETAISASTAEDGVMEAVFCSL